MKTPYPPTYQTAKLQTKAYRNLKLAVAELLKPHGLSMIQWAALGVIKDAGKRGTQMSDIASELSTSLAFTTNTIDILASRRLVRRKASPTDKRVRTVIITTTAEKIIDDYELQLQKSVRTDLFAKAGISKDEHDAYLHVLAKLADVKL